MQSLHRYTSRRRTGLQRTERTFRLKWQPAREEEYRRDADDVQRQPTHCEDRMVAWRRGDGWGLCHDLFQADVEFRLALVALV